MKIYHKIMQFSWLITAVVVIVVVTYKGINQGFDRWGLYYIFGLLAFMIFLLRRYMMKRTERHQEFLKEQKSKKQV